jgi:hypothetical protein
MVRKDAHIEKLQWLTVATVVMVNTKRAVRTSTGPSPIVSPTTALAAIILPTGGNSSTLATHTQAHGAHA